MTKEIVKGARREKTDRSADLDPLEKAGMESFPANDAPSWTP